MKRHNWTGETAVCADCGQSYFNLKTGGCFAPKPATPEPPEWKGDAVAPDYTTPLDLTGLARHMPPSVMCANYTPLAEGRARLERDGLLTPDPVTDFIARRVAKREAPYWRPVPGLPMPDGLFERGDGGEGWDIARAMSQPGPHDPDIHTRLMPWKGKTHD